MKITREIDPNELIISHRFTYQANGRIIGLRRVPEASNILCLRHGSSVWILVCSSYGHFCCSGCSSPVDFGMSVNCYGFFLQTINGSSECTCWSKKNHGHISESCSQRLRGDEQHSLLIIRLILSCPPICRAQREVLPSNMRHEFVHYNNTNQDQQSDEQRCCPKLVLGSSKSPSRRVYIILATFTYGVGKSPKKSHAK